MRYIKQYIRVKRVYTKIRTTIQAKPNEEDYEDDDEYEQAYDNYRNQLGEIKENLMFQTHYAMNLFDNKQVREKTLLKRNVAKIYRNFENKKILNTKLI